MEGHPAPAAAETRPEEAVAAQQEPELAGSSRAVVVEIPDDNSRRPGGISG
jgi:hypothetical protein